jgi:hypothetical protein
MRFPSLTGSRRAVLAAAAVALVVSMAVHA